MGPGVVVLNASKQTISKHTSLFVKYDVQAVNKCLTNSFILLQMQQMKRALKNIVVT